MAYPAPTCCGKLMYVSQEALAFVEYCDGLKGDGRWSTNYSYRGGRHHVIPRHLLRVGPKFLKCTLCHKTYVATQDDRGRWLKGDEVTSPSLIDQMANGVDAR